MNQKFIKKRIVIAAMVGMILAPTAQVFAEEAVTILNTPKKNEEVVFNQNALVNAAEELNGNISVEKVLKMESSEEVKLNKLLSEKVFVKVSKEGYLQVNEQAKEGSSYIGKLYEDTTIQVVERNNEWSKISSGNVDGFVKTENLISGKEAATKAEVILSEKHPEKEIATLDQETIENSFSVGETVEEEAARLAAEEAARVQAEEQRIAAEKAAKAKASLEKGQAVVNFANQFIGNPYVYGGTSLTNGTDCSGFVRGVYSNFGISLPRTSGSMRSVGYSVSFSEIQPGDIVCYSGHVGIYAGNGQIVNAIDESRGIGMSSVKYANIITIRRIF